MTAARDTLRAEWTKQRTVPGTTWLVLAVAAATIALSVAASASLHCPPGGCAVDPVKLSLTGVQLGQALVAVLAVLMVGSEYSTGLIRLSLAAQPRRGVVLAGKATVLTALVLPAAVFGVLVSLLVGRLILPGRGFTLPGLTDPALLRATLGSVLYLLLIALLSLGIALAVRDSAAAIGIVLGLLYVFPIVIQVVTDPHWKRHLQQIAPMSAGLVVQATTGLDALPLGPWRGLGVLAGWAVLALLAGGLLLRWRDA